MRAHDVVLNSMNRPADAATHTRDVSQLVNCDVMRAVPLRKTPGPCVSRSEARDALATRRGPVPHGFLRQTLHEVPKNFRNHREKERALFCPAYFAYGVCSSPLRNNHNDKRSGISESTK